MKGVRHAAVARAGSARSCRTSVLLTRAARRTPHERRLKAWLRTNKPKSGQSNRHRSALMMRGAKVRYRALEI